MTKIARQTHPPKEPGVAEVDRRFDLEDTRTITIVPALRYPLLQAGILGTLVDDLGSFAKVVFNSGSLPDFSWSLSATTTLTALGEKAREVPCGHVLRRIIGGGILKAFSTSLRGLCHPPSRNGVRVEGRLELVAELTMLGHQRGCTILSYDGVLAYNSIKRLKMLRALARYVLSVAREALNIMQVLGECCFSVGSTGGCTLSTKHSSRIGT